MRFQQNSMSYGWKRLAFTGALFVSVFLLPWWVTLCIALIALFYIPSFYELILVGLYFDMIYATPQIGLFSYTYIGIMVSAVLVLFAHVMRFRLGV